MSDEEIVNPKPEIEESCKPKCIKAWLEYEVRTTSAGILYLALAVCGFGRSIKDAAVCGMKCVLIGLEILISSVDDGAGVPKACSRRYHWRSSLYWSGRSKLILFLCTVKAHKMYA
jgi:hypothetical protein